MTVATKIGLIAGASALALTLAGTAMAQTAAPSVAQQGAGTVDEVVVTANKREQRLNDVGVTVAVVGGENLKQRQINNLADLAQTVPSLTYANSANGTPIYTLRGVGFIETSIGSYPTVSTYLDEVALSFPVLGTHSAFDLTRVEVLKGPQGTLFGQNATGGAINYIAAKPTETYQAGVDLSYGRFNQIIGEGYVSGPLSDTLKGRITGRFERADGWQVSNTRPGDRNGKVRNYMARILLDYQPNDRTHFLLNLNGWKDGGETQAPQFIALQVQQPGLIDPDVASQKFSPQKPRAADWTPGLPYRDNRLWQASLRGDFELSDRITLTSLTGYTDYSQNQRDEADGLPAVTLDLLGDAGDIQSFSQELRLANDPGNALRWVIGANYERSDTSQTIDLSVADSSTYQLFGNVLGYTGFGDLRYGTDQAFTNYAFFGNIEYDIIPTVTLKGGIRYTDAKTKAELYAKDITGSPLGTGALFYDVLLGGAFGPYVSGQPYAINNLPVTVNGVAPGAPGGYAGTLEEDNVSYRVGVDWKPRGGTLIYANIAKGYKAGSFPTVSASVFSQYQPVTQESVQSYEVGFKTSLFNRMAQLNGAAFYYDYQDKQLRSKVVDPLFGILDVLQNVPKSSIKGAELELTVRPASNLVINSAFTYIDATIDRFTGVNAGGLAATFDGTPIPFTPKYQLGTNIDWTHPMSNGLEGFVGASVNYRSQTTAVIGGDTNPPNASPQTFKIFGIDAYTTVDLRAGVRAPDDRWRFTVWGKNITNEYYWNNVVAATDTISRYAAPGATYGMSVAFRY